MWGTGIFIRITPDLTTSEDIESEHLLHDLNGGFTKASFTWEGERVEVASMYAPDKADNRKAFLDKLRKPSPTWPASTSVELCYVLQLFGPVTLCAKDSAWTRPLGAPPRCL